MIRSIFLMLVVFIAFGCKSRREMQLKQIDNVLLEQYFQQQLTYDFLSLKGKATMVDGAQSNTVNMHIRMKKDSILWASFSLLGFEGARILITKDSFKMINRLNNTFILRSTDFLQSYVGIEVKLIEIQQMLVGNAPYEKNLYQIENRDSGSFLTAHHQGIENSLNLNEALQTIFSVFSSQLYAQRAQFEYTSYRNMNGINLPQEIRAQFDLDQKVSEISINYQSADSQKILSFPFSISGNLKRI